MTIMNRGQKTSPKTSRKTRTLVRSMAFCAALLVAGLSAQSWAQTQALPPDVAQAIEEAMRLSDMAAVNAAFSANIANAGLPTTIADRTRLQVTQSNLAEAVVNGIARHPQSAAAIVSAAVRRAPAHAPAIVHRASIAFPSFASIIAAAAGMPTAAPGYVAYTPPVYAQPTPAPVIQTAQTVLEQPTAAVPVRGAASPSGPWPNFGLSEMRLGVVHHDTGVFGNNKEDSVDIAFGVRFQPLGGDIWDYLQNPRPFINANLNTSGETSGFDMGVNWDWDIWRRTFFSWAMGGALHTGKLQTSRLDRKELGSRVLFYLAAELGYRFDQTHSLSLRLDHMSNASLADHNEGLDTVGLIYGYHF